MMTKLTMKFWIALEWYFTCFSFYIAALFQGYFLWWSSFKVINIKRNWFAHELYLNERKIKWSAINTATYIDALTYRMAMHLSLCLLTNRWEKVLERFDALADTWKYPMTWCKFVFHRCHYFSSTFGDNRVKFPFSKLHRAPTGKPLKLLSSLMSIKPVIF